MRKRFAGLTPTQLRVFEQIATGNDAGHHPATLESLEKHGMITSYEETLTGVPRVTINRYFVPFAWHIRWCEWCAEQPNNEIAPD